VTPPKANRKVKRDYDFVLYCERNLVERFFNKIKHYRAIATRYDKLALLYCSTELRTGPNQVSLG
jgi:transposase